MIYYISRQLTFHDSRICQCTEEQAYKYLSKQKVLQVDTETTGLSFVDDTLLTLQVGTKDHQFVFDVAVAGVWQP
jgi:ribonuclease D